MVVAQVTTVPPLFSTPYITAAEFKQAPTGTDVTNLVSRDPEASLAELVNVIGRASSWADQYCDQVLAATTDTDEEWARIARDGWFHLHPRYNPILSLTSFASGTQPSNLASLTDLSQTWIDQRGQTIWVPAQSSLFFSTQGPLQFGSGGYGTDMLVQYTYVNGYPNTLLTATAAAAATSIQVADATGVLAGLTQLGIYDGAQTEYVKVAATYGGGTTLPLAAPLLYTHQQVGVSVSALPPAVKQAVILLTANLVKMRGIGGIVAPRAGSQQASSSKSSDGVDVDTAYELLDPFRRVR